MEYVLLKHLNFKDIGMMNEINGSNPFRSTFNDDEEVDVLIFFLLTMFMKLGQAKVTHIKASSTVADFPKPSDTAVIDEFFADLIMELLDSDV